IVFGKRVASAPSISWIRGDGATEAYEVYRGQTGDPQSFAPDGKSLAIQITNGETGNDIAILQLDLSNPENPKPGNPEMFVQTPLNDAEPSFSPDGHWIAYRSGETGPAGIFIRPYRSSNMNSGGQLQIANRGRSPQWSRDGKKLFYMSDGQIMSADINI